MERAPNACACNSPREPTRRFESTEHPSPTGFRFYFTPTPRNGVLLVLPSRVLVQPLSSISIFSTIEDRTPPHRHKRISVSPPYTLLHKRARPNKHSRLQDYHPQRRTSNAVRTTTNDYLVCGYSNHRHYFTRTSVCISCSLDILDCFSSLGDALLTLLCTE